MTALSRFAATSSPASFHALLKTLIFPVGAGAGIGERLQLLRVSRRQMLCAEDALVASPVLGHLWLWPRPRPKDRGLECSDALHGRLVGRREARSRLVQRQWLRTPRLNSTCLTAMEPFVPAEEAFSRASWHLR